MPAPSTGPVDMDRGDRPSRHGQLLGQALAIIAAAGRKDMPGLPDECLTCAFREGSVPNQTAGTGMIALNCVLGVDPDRFACHHGMKDGQPRRVCAGYAAARCAPFSFVREVLAATFAELRGLDDTAADSVREAFDAWAANADPRHKMDVYQIARAFALAEGTP